ncbi:F-box only protein 24 [Discoglossus pictus]
MALEDEPFTSEDTYHLNGVEQRASTNSTRSNEVVGFKWRGCFAVDVSVEERKVCCCNEQFRTGTWNVKRKRSLPLPPEVICRNSPVTFQELPIELLDHVISYLSVRDVVILGETCRYLHQVCNSPGIWRRICGRICHRHRVRENDWRRAAILNYTKGMYFQSFGGRRRVLSRSVDPSPSHGFRRFLPTKDHAFVLDYAGTLFFLRNALVSSAHGHVQWKRACRYVALCRSVKDFSSDPRNDAIYRKFLYVLASRDPGSLGHREPQSLTPGPCDCVEVYLQSSGQRVFKMTFHPSMRFKQIVLLGPETERILLLLTEEGKVYSLVVDETHLDQPRSYTVQLSLRKVSRCLSHMAVTQIYVNQSSVIYVTDLGTVYLEVHTPGIYRDLFGTLQAFDSLDPQMPLALSLTSKIVLCSLGYNHLALVDEFGRIFMQGNNRYGQLGTGDKIDRGEPCQVRYLRCPVDIWCGLNHTLVLTQSPDFAKEIHGCGCGAGGRLPGWPKGSPSFIKLLVKVPLCVRYICSTRDCLYMLSSYDTEEVSAYRELPTARWSCLGTEGEAEAAQACKDYLSQLLQCSTLQERVAKTKDIVGQMPLLGYQKDFLWEALSVIQRAAESKDNGG